MEIEIKGEFGTLNDGMDILIDILKSLVEGKTEGEIELNPADMIVWKIKGG